MNLKTNFEPAGITYQQSRIAHWDSIARKRDRWNGMGQWYHKRLEEVYRFLVSPGLRVLEIGCSDGNLLAVAWGLAKREQAESILMVMEATRMAEPVPTRRRQAAPRSAPTASSTSAATAPTPATRG